MGKIIVTVFTKLGGAVILLIDDVLRIFTAFFESLFLIFANTFYAISRVASKIIDNVYEFFNFNSDDRAQSLYIILNSLTI
tara:strand:+ start:154 stop:396 length:243 start_codon:yes stop_codon:yes gene_type:complete